MLRPQALSGDLMRVRRAGIDTVISLLEPAEAVELGLATQAQACASAGLTFLSFPIRDMHLPQPAAFATFTHDIVRRLRGGDAIAIHCHASIGRSGMLACCTLSHFGFSAADALRHTSARRGVPVPDTPAQTAFIHKMIADASL